MAFDPGGFLRAYRRDYFDQSLPASVVQAKASKTTKPREVEPPVPPQAALADSVDDDTAPEALAPETTSPEASPPVVGGTGLRAAKANGGVTKRPQIRK